LAGILRFVFWPYRPRQGYPSVPTWLLVVVLVGGALLFLWSVDALGGSGNPDDKYGPLKAVFPPGRF
jgi:hypothetical protein